MNATPLKIVALLLFLFAAGAQAETREFTDLQGRTMTAELVNVVGNKVRLKRDDGAAFTVSPDLFCEEDAAYIRLWMLRTLAERDSLLDINAKASGTTAKKVDVDPAVKVKKWDGFYRIDLENESDMDLTEIHVEYVYLAYHMVPSKDKKGEGKTSAIPGDLTIPRIKARATFSFDSTKTDMMVTELANGYYWSDGGSDETKDKLEGVWIRIYYSGHLLMDWSNPSTLKEKYDWKKITK